MWHLITLPLMVGVPSMLLVFFAMYFGAGSINAVIKLIPQVVLDGFDVAAGVLSCVGLALLIKMMGNKKLMPYLFLGFIAVMYINMDVIDQYGCDWSRSGRTVHGAYCRGKYEI